ncbi:disks large-associated protein 1-like [Bradysia coprophila]|uniref:disks large-associated protein 1-like n=1 Tax=Bradysia coprophila TaxID=38358 RepID=UPI00187D7455|nr:disks large-associated protein 1-like [Bradysia coprophila]
MQKVEYWTKYKAENDHVDSVYVDQIDVAIGQTRLLITKKFNQFLGLCDECEKGTSQPPVLPKDLEGFWSMVYIQVENCGLRFQKLMTLQENDWVEADLLPVKVIKQTRNRKAAKKGGAASSGIQKMIEEARLKMKESKIAATATNSSNTDGGNGFSMTLRQTPARLSLSTIKTPRSIIKVKTPGVKRSTKSVAFSFIESPTASRSLRVAATPNPKVIKRRASTSGVPSEKKGMTTDGVSAFLTPNNRKVSTAPATSADRRSSRRLFSNVEN